MAITKATKMIFTITGEMNGLLYTKENKVSGFKEWGIDELKFINAEMYEFKIQIPEQKKIIRGNCYFTSEGFIGTGVLTLDGG